MPVQQTRTLTGIATLVVEGTNLSQGNLLLNALQIPWESHCIELMEILLDVGVDINARALHCEGPAIAL